MKTILVSMRVHEQEDNRPNPEMVEVFWFEWDPGDQFPREGETLVVDELPLTVRKITWGEDAVARNLHPSIEVYRQPDHPALRTDDDQDQDVGP